MCGAGCAVCLSVCLSVCVCACACVVCMSASCVLCIVYVCVVYICVRACVSTSHRADAVATVTVSGGKLRLVPLEGAPILESKVQ